MSVPPTQPPAPPAAPAAPAKADIGKRFIAALIDGIPAIIIAFVLGLIPFIGPIVGGLVVAAWWLFRDGLDVDFADHRSLGKKVMKLRPVTADGRSIDLATSAKRNLPLAIYAVGYLLWVVPVLGHLASIPIFLLGSLVILIEGVLVLTDPAGRRMGDKFAGTTVVEVAS